DQHHAHLLACGAQGAGDDLQFDRVEHLAQPTAESGPVRRSRWTVPWTSTSPDHPGGTRSVDSGRAHSAGPSTSAPGGSSPRKTAASTESLSNTIGRVSTAGTAATPASGRAEGDGPHTDT